jgi:hypothetical protein
MDSLLAIWVGVCDDRDLHTNAQVALARDRRTDRGPDSGMWAS